MVHHQDTHLHRHLLSHRMKLTRHSCHLGTHMLHRKVKVIKGILMEVGILLHHLSNFLLTRSTSMISIIITVMIIMMMVRPSYRDVWLPFVAAVCLKNAASKRQWISCPNIWDPVILSGVLDIYLLSMDSLCLHMCSLSDRYVPTM